MNEQNLFLDNQNISPLQESLIHNKTDVLNVFVDDSVDSTGSALIGKKFEWKPLLWMMHQKERILHLSKFRLIVCEGKWSTATKQSVGNTLPGVDVEFIDVALSGSYQFYVNSAKNASDYQDTDRETLLYYSVGTMRLPRLIITHWSLKNDIKNIGYPAMSQLELSSFLHQISKLSDYDIGDYVNTSKRFFGQISEHKFNIRQSAKLRECRINIVSEQPWFDHIEGFLCEKFTDAVANKCLPFFIGNGDDNQYISLLGFKPYVGFDYSSLKRKNFIDRWTSLLVDNKNVFLDTDKNKEIYDLNKHVIDYNFGVLLQTDWLQKATDEIETLPPHVKQFLIKQFFS